MPLHPYRISVDANARPLLDALLADRLYAFNVRATGIHDVGLLAASVHDDAGELVAGLTGHTWGGCCEISKLWVAEACRGRGLGTALVRAAEAEAVRYGCVQIVLTTHSFQAPRFYERLGFVRVGAFADYPWGHEQVFYRKALPAAAR